MAVLPFEVAGEKEAVLRNVAQLLTDALASRFQVPTSDGHELLGHWTEDRHQITDPLDKKAGFAYEHGANQMILGTATQAGAQLRLAVDLYDTHDVTRLSHAEATGNADSLFRLVERLAGQVADSLCSQPDYNPHGRCYDVAARAVESLSVADVGKPGEVRPSPPTFLVRVDSAGRFMDVRTKTPSSHDDVNAAALALVRSATYRAAKRRGTPVTSWASVTVTVRSESAPPTAAAGPSECDSPGQNPGRACFDSRPVPLAAPVAPWSSAGAPTPPVLWLRVGTDGAVHEVRVFSPSSEPQFTEAARRAAERMTFNPALKGGKPVTAWTQIAITKE